MVAISHRSYTEEQWVSVYTTEDGIEADVIRSKLEAYGIPARVASETLSRLGFAVGPLARTEVLVPESCVDDATEIVVSVNDNFESEWD